MRGVVGRREAGIKVSGRAKRRGEKKKERPKEEKERKGKERGKGGMWDKGC